MLLFNSNTDTPIYVAILFRRSGPLLLLENDCPEITINTDNILRRSGPLLLRRAVRPGFSGASMSRTGSHPRRTRWRAIGAAISPPSQALKNAPLAAFFTHAISAPLAPLRVRGACRKNPTADAEKHRHPDQEQFPRWTMQRRGRRRFFRVCPERSGSGGMRRWRGNERLPKAALLSVCEENVTWRSEAKRSAAVSFFEGASAAS